MRFIFIKRVLEFNIMCAVPGIISAMEKFENTKTCGNFFKILDEVEKMELVNPNFMCI